MRKKYIKIFIIAVLFITTFLYNSILSYAKIINGVNVPFLTDDKTKKEIPECNKISTTDWDKIKNVDEIKNNCVKVKYYSSGNSRIIGKYDCDDLACNPVYDADANYCGKSSKGVCLYTTENVLNSCQSLVNACYLSKEIANINSISELNAWLLNPVNSAELAQQNSIRGRYPICSAYYSGCVNSTEINQGCESKCKEEAETYCKEHSSGQYNAYRSCMNSKSSDIKQCTTACLTDCDKKVCPTGWKKDKNCQCYNPEGSGNKPDAGIPCCTAEQTKYVEKALVSMNCRVCGNDECGYSSCTKVQQKKISTVKTGDVRVGKTYLNGHEYEANRYDGYCIDGNDISYPVDVFCIDPATQFKSDGYICQASLNDDVTLSDGQPNTDIGYIQIYQDSLKKYQEQYMRDETNDDKYLALHLAFRLYTFNKEINVNLLGNTEGTKDKIKAFKNTSAMIYGGRDEFGSLIDGAFMTGMDINKVASNNDGRTYFLVRDNIDYVASTNNSGSRGYMDAVKMYLEAVTKPDIWETPLEFNIVNPSNDYRNYDFVLKGISKLGDEGSFGKSYVTGIYVCEDGTSITDGTCKTDSYHNLLKTPISPVTASTPDMVSGSFTVSTGAKFKLIVKFYDIRDKRNLTIGTKNKDTGFQRLIYVAKHARDFYYEQEYNPRIKTCDIVGHNYYDSKGVKTTDLDKFIRECCDEMNGSQALWERFTSLNPEYKNQEEWLRNGCILYCDPKNTTDVCTKEENGEKQIIVSDLTPIDNNDNYDYSCASSGSDAAGNSYACVTTNPYCSISCVERYKFNVPTHVATNGTIKYGRYLQVSVGAEGTRECFTSTNSKIDYDKFKTDYDKKMSEIQAANELLTQWNNYIGSFGPANISSTHSPCTEPYRECNGKSDDGVNCYVMFNGIRVDLAWTEGTRNCLNGAGYDSYYTSGAPNVSTTTNGVTVTRDGNVSSTGSCSGCSGTSGDGSSADGHTLKNQLISNRNAQYNEVQKLINELNVIITNYNNCSKPLTNWKFEPVIDFEYEDAYMKKITGNQRKLTGTSQTLNSTIEYCHGDTVDKTYNYSPKGTTIKCNSINNVQKVSIYQCNDGDKKCSLITNGQEIYKNTFVKQSETRAATLKSSNQWYTQIGTGKSALGTKPAGNWYTLPNGIWPISRECATKDEGYHYSMKLENLGNYCNATTGRLNQVIASIKGDNANNNDTYACDYNVNQKSCEGCETTYFYRSISLDDVFPKQKVESSSDGQVKHPNPDRTVVGVWDTEFGKAARKQIEKDGQEIYDDNPDSGHRFYSFTLTPAGMRSIREYNRSDGRNYGDFDLECDDNGRCYSNFLLKVAQKQFAGVTDNLNEGVNISGMESYKPTVKFKVYEDGKWVTK